MALIGSRADRVLVSSRGCLKLEAGLIDVDIVKFENAAQHVLLQPNQLVDLVKVTTLIEQSRAGVMLGYSDWRHFTQVQPVTPGPKMLGYITSRCMLSKAEHACGLINSAAAGVAITLPLRMRYGIYRDALVELDIVAAYAASHGDNATAARLYGGAHALRLRSLHVARPYLVPLHADARDRSRAAYPAEWSRGTTLTLKQLIEDTYAYLSKTGLAE